MQETKKINPLIALAAVSVILFSIVGVGVMTGLIPNSFSKNKESALETAASKPAAEESKTGKAEAVPAPKQKTAAKHSTTQTAQAPQQQVFANAWADCGHCPPGAWLEGEAIHPNPLLHR